MLESVALLAMVVKDPLIFILALVWPILTALLLCGGCQSDSLPGEWTATCTYTINPLGNKQGTVYDLKLSETDSILAAAMFTGQIFLYDSISGDHIRTLSGHAKSTQAISFSKSGRLLASAGGDRVVRVWDVASGEMVKEWHGHQGYVRDVDFMGDEKVISGGDDRSVRIWSLTDGADRTIQQDEGMIRTLEYWELTQEVASGSDDGSVRFYSISDGSLQSSISAREEDMTMDIAVYPEQKKFISVHYGRPAILWDREKGLEIDRSERSGFPWQLVGYSCVAIDDKSTWAAFGSDDGVVVIWDILSWKQLAKIRAHSGMVTCVRIAEQGSVLYTGSSDCTIKKWIIGKFR